MTASHAGVGQPPGGASPASLPAAVGAAMARLTAYADAHGRTLEDYDLAGAGDANRLTAWEVARTRVIASRISTSQERWFLKQSLSAPWSAVPVDADLRAADPDQPAGLYPAMAQLYEHFHANRPAGVNHAKVSKVLHLKRPALYPILDSRLMRHYRLGAEREARSRPQLGHRRMYWAAVRTHLLAEDSRTCLTRVRAELSSAEADSPYRRLVHLSDLRLLDILTW